MADEILSQAEIEALMAGAAASNAGQADPPAADPGSQPEAQQAVGVPADGVQFTPGGADPAVQMPIGAPQVQSAAPQISVKTPHQDSTVRPMQFAPLSSGGDAAQRSSVDLIMDVQLHVAVELGRTVMQVRDVLALGPGSVVELDKHSGEPVEVVVNNKIVARGEVVVIDENFGVRITEIVNSKGRDVDLQAA